MKIERKREVYIQNFWSENDYRICQAIPNSDGPCHCRNTFLSKTTLSFTQFVPHSPSRFESIILWKMALLNRTENVLLISELWRGKEWSRTELYKKRHIQGNKLEYNVKWVMEEWEMKAVVIGKESIYSSSSFLSLNISHKSWKKELGLQPLNHKHVNYQLCGNCT